MRNHDPTLIIHTVDCRRHDFTECLVIVFQATVSAGTATTTSLLVRPVYVFEMVTLKPTPRVVFYVTNYYYNHLLRQCVLFLCRWSSHRQICKQNRASAGRS